MGVIKELWKPKVAVEAMAIGEDCILFSFNTEEDMRIILRGRPWFFGVLGLNTWASPILMYVRMGEMLGEAIGRVVKVDCDAYGGCVGEFLCLRVGIDVTLPLKRGLKDTVWNVVEGWSTYIGFEEDMNYMEVDDNGEFIRVAVEEGGLCEIGGTGLQVEQGGVVNESGERA
ncbi:hypothetical protein ACFX2G_008577 [Malus domestica]